MFDAVQYWCEWCDRCKHSNVGDFIDEGPCSNCKGSPKYSIPPTNFKSIKYEEEEK
jgi:hypothetical protein